MGFLDDIMNVIVPGSGGLFGGGGGGTPQIGSQIDPGMFLSMAPPGFMGLQGSMPGLGQGMDFNQLSLMMGLTSGAPQRIDQFQGQTQGEIKRLGKAGHRAIDQSASQGFANQASQLGATQRQSNRTQGDAFAAMGMAPSTFQANVRPQQEMDLSAMLGQARGQSQAGAAQAHQGLREEQFDRRTGLNQSTMNARNQLEQYYDSMLLQKYLAEMAAQAQMQAASQAASSGMFGDLLGSAATLGAAAIMSDARLKEDVHTLVPGRPRLVSWRWNRTAERLGLHGRGVGVIAQELELVAPERVVVTPSGFKAVLVG